MGVGARTPEVQMLDETGWERSVWGIRAGNRNAETSQAILRPRGGIGYQQEGKVTSHNSIQVTVGRVITPSKDRAQANTAILNQDSNATLANLEADRKVEASRCRVFEDLGTALFTVGQKSLHQLGVRSEMTQQ